MYFGRMGADRLAYGHRRHEEARVEPDRSLLRRDQPPMGDEKVRGERQVLSLKEGAERRRVVSHFGVMRRVDVADLRRVDRSTL
jgi:hypothetical protein